MPRPNEFGPTRSAFLYPTSVRRLKAHALFDDIAMWRHRKSIKRVNRPVEALEDSRSHRDVEREVPSVSLP